MPRALGGSMTAAPTGCTPQTLASQCHCSQDVYGSANERSVKLNWMRSCNQDVQEGGAGLEQ